MIIDMSPMLLFFIVLLLTLFLFFLDKWRYDIVALFSLLLLTVFGIVPANEAYSGFQHPAVITVAAMLIVSKAIMKTGMMSKITSFIWKLTPNPVMHILLLSLFVALLSAFMNNVGALALGIPIALDLAKRGKYSPSLLMMPLAFSSLVGGLNTLIGTPPNIIIATFREAHIGQAFGLFEFLPTGFLITLIGVAFIALLGWRLLPLRAKNLDEEMISFNDYVTEVRIPKDHPLIGKTLYTIKKEIKVEEWNVLSVFRDKSRIQAPDRRYHIRQGDVLVIEASPETIKALITASSWVFEAQTSKHSSEVLVDEESVIQECVVMSSSKMIGKNILQLLIRTHYSINVLGLSRQGKMFRDRIVAIKIKAGDVLLLQGTKDSFRSFFEDMLCLPLEIKGWEFPSGKQNPLPIYWFVLTLFLVLGGLLPFHIAFMILVLALILFGHINLNEVYASLEGPVLVLLAAMIPVGMAMQTTGGASWIAQKLLLLSNLLPAPILLGVLMLLTMLLSNILNNAATAILMAPIALELSKYLSFSADPFLMGVAIAASCAFLTPIGHQSNTLVMGPGAYRFNDYWRMGLPLSVLVLVCSIPILLWVWPF
jgi:di/tricarboxylate transporter